MLVIQTALYLIFMIYFLGIEMLWQFLNTLKNHLDTKGNVINLSRASFYYLYTS